MKFGHIRKSTSYKLLSRYLKNQNLKFIMLSFTVVLGIIIQIINPQIVRTFIDAAITPSPKSRLLSMALAFFCLAFLQQFLAVGSTYLAQKIGWQATNTLKEDLVAHALKLDMGYFKTMRQGEIIEIIEGDVNVLFNFFSRMVIVLVSNILLIFGVLAMYYREDYRIGIGQTLFVLMAFYLTGKIKDFSVGYWKSNRQKMGEVFGFMGEVIQNTEDLNANGAKTYALKNSQKLLMDWMPIRIRAGIAGWSFYMLSLFLQMTSFGISLLLGTWLWQQGMVSVGTIYMFYAYTNYLNRPIDAIQRQLQDIQNVSASMGRIKELLERESNIKEAELPRPLNSPVRIDLESVCFEYEAGETVLEDLSLSLKPGQCLGVIGRTGSGKTTLARLLIRLYDVQKGEIYLNDISIKSFSLKSLRKKIAYVTQDVQLFSGTIRDNLTFFNKDISDQMLTEAITAMGMEDWFSKYKDGFDTLIGTGGVGLSAGESQLLTFVRLFLTNPDVIILDEVSSRLDPETERQLQKTIERLLRNRIGIIIAHKLWTLEQVEDILVLEKGKVLEYGKRAMLLNDENSRLSQLMAIGAEEVLA